MTINGLIRPTRRTLLLGAGAGVVLASGCGGNTKTDAPGKGSSPSPSVDEGRTIVVSKFHALAFSFVVPPTMKLKVSSTADPMIEATADDVQIPIRVRPSRVLPEGKDRVDSKPGETSTFETTSGLKATADTDSSGTKRVAITMRPIDDEYKLVLVFRIYTKVDAESPARFGKDDVQSLLKSVRLEPELDPKDEAIYNGQGSLMIAKSPPSPDPAYTCTKEPAASFDLSLALLKGADVHGLLKMNTVDKLDLKATVERFMRINKDWSPAKEADLGGVKALVSTSPGGDQRNAFFEKDGVVIEAFLFEKKKGSSDALTKLFAATVPALVVVKEAVGVAYSL